MHQISAWWLCCEKFSFIHYFPLPCTLITRHPICDSYLNGVRWGRLLWGETESHEFVQTLLQSDPSSTSTIMLLRWSLYFLGHSISWYEVEVSSVALQFVHNTGEKPLNVPKTSNQLQRTPVTARMHWLGGLESFVRNCTCVYVRGHDLSLVTGMSHHHRHRHYHQTKK